MRGGGGGVGSLCRLAGVVAAVFDDPAPAVDAVEDAPAAPVFAAVRRDE